MLNFILQAFFQSAQHIYEKREGSGVGCGSVPLTNRSGFWKAQNHVDPADPNPRHCQICISSSHPLSAQLSPFPLIASSCTFNSLLPIHLILLRLKSFPQISIQAYLPIAPPFQYPFPFLTPYPPLIRQFSTFHSLLLQHLRIS